MQWDIVGLAETWLDEESEKGVAVRGYGAVCASRKEKGGGGVALLLRDGLVYRERPDLGKFKEGVFESLFLEIIRGGGRRNDVVGVVYRPPGGNMGLFNAEMVRTLLLLRGTDAYIMGDFNVDLMKTDTRTYFRFLGGIHIGGLLPAGVSSHKNYGHNGDTYRQHMDK